MGLGAEGKDQQEATQPLLESDGVTASRSDGGHDSAEPLKPVYRGDPTRAVEVRLSISDA